MSGWKKLPAIFHICAQQYEASFANGQLEYQIICKSFAPFVQCIIVQFDFLDFAEKVHGDQQLSKVIHISAFGKKNAQQLISFSKGLPSLSNLYYIYIWPLI